MGPEALPGPLAVARPIGLLQAMRPGDPPVLSWSTVTGPTLVMGRAARHPDLHAAALDVHDVTVTHRRSGGGPVLWDAGLLAMDVLLPPGHALAGHDVTLAYRWLGEAVADALTTLGVPSRSVSIDEARAAQARTDDAAVAAAAACFGGVSPFEVVGPNGRKTVGLSQMRRRTGTLFQCGIALTLDTATLAALLHADPGDAARMDAALASMATGVTAHRADVTPGEVIRAVEAALRSREGVVLTA